jgi:hypothetical protein
MFSDIERGPEAALKIAVSMHLVWGSDWCTLTADFADAAGTRATQRW